MDIPDKIHLATNRHLQVLNMANEITLQFQNTKLCIVENYVLTRLAMLPPWAAHETDTHHKAGRLRPFTC